MRGLSPKPGLEIGAVYRDFDGSLVRLLAVHGDVCCWGGISSSAETAQMTHRDNFLRRFLPLSAVAKPVRTRNKSKQSRRLPQATLSSPKAA